MDLKAILLDIDGTLIDSNDAHARAFQEVFELHGHSVEFRVIRRCVGMGGDKLIEKVLGKETASREGDTLAKEKSALFREKYLPTVVPFPRANELLVKLKNAGFRLAVATAADEAERAGLLEILGVESLIDGLPDQKSVAETKPDPDVVRAALHTVHAAPSQSVLIGDTPYDIEAAASAGVPCIAFRSGGWEDAELKGSLAIYDDPWDLLKHLETSPLRDRFQLAG